MRSHRYALMGLCQMGAYAMLFGCGGSGGSAAPSPAPSQVVAMSINTPNSSVPFTAQELDDAVALAQGAGVRGVIATYTWSSLETTPGHIDVSSLQSGLSYYHQKGLEVLLGIQVIN